ncbi:MAG: flavodoxin family protein [Candidatus Hodarchaeota archaeon]
MRVLIIYTSQSGNTKKVVDLVKDQLTSKDYTVTVKNALTAKQHNIDEAELLILGTPVHGYILFGQRPAKPMIQFLESQLPDDLSGKPIIGFATYLFFPAGALNSIKMAIERRNGNLLDLFTNKRSNKVILANKIVQCILQYVN